MSKYGNRKTEYAGNVYHSRKEAAYAAELDMLKRAEDPRHRVTEYETQKSFDIIVNRTKVCRYIADFDVLYADGRREIVDVKGYRTAIYKLKKKMFEACYPHLKIIEK